MPPTPSVSFDSSGIMRACQVIPPSEIVKIEADVGSARFRLQTAQERLADLKGQLDSCIVRAPTRASIYMLILNSVHRPCIDPCIRLYAGSEFRASSVHRPVHPSIC